MSNIVSIQFTSFQDLDDSGNLIGGPDFGYRIYDDYEQAYDNCYDSIYAIQEDGLTPEGVFDFIDERHDSFSPTAREKGVYLNGKWIAPPKGGDADDRE